MGTTNEKENAEKVIDSINKSNILQSQELILGSFKLMTKIVNEYDQLKSNLGNTQTPPNTSQTIRLMSPEFMKQRLERIKKWIYMAKTISCRGSFYHNTYQSNLSNKDNMKQDNDPNKRNRSMSVLHRKKPIISYKNCNIILPTNNSNDTFNINTEANSISNNTSLCTVYNAGGNTNQNNNPVIDMSHYTDEVIEKGLNNFYIRNTKKFMERLSKGPPFSFRPPAWYVVNNLCSERKEDIYNYFTKKNIPEDIKNSILRDIGRTFPYVDTASSIDIQSKETSLYNVLKAFANLDTNISYCQGMNLIVAFLLIACDYDEKNAFFLLVSLFGDNFVVREICDNEIDKLNYSLRGMYSEGFPLLHFMRYVFEEKFREYFPELKSKFDDMEIPSDVWVGKWYQTMFTIVLPIEQCMRLWDCIFVHGICFMINFSIIFIKAMQKDLISLNDEIEIIEYFKSMMKFALSDTDSSFNVQKIDALLLKAKKIKIDLHFYLQKFNAEKCKTFNEDMKKISIEYDLNISKLNNKITFFFENEHNTNNSNGINELNDSNALRSSKAILKYAKEPILENYDEDLDENISIEDESEEEKCEDEVNQDFNFGDKLKKYSLKSSVVHNLRKYEFDSKPIKTLSEIQNSFGLNKISKYNRMKTMIAPKKKKDDENTNSVHDNISIGKSSLRMSNISPIAIKNSNDSHKSSESSFKAQLKKSNTQQFSFL